MTLGELLLVFCATVFPTAALEQGSILDSQGNPDPSFPGFHSWFDAADGINGGGQPNEGDPVSSWGDLTGNGHTLDQTPSSTSDRPQWRDAVANGYPALEFDGSDYIWATSSQFGVLSGSKTVFFVCKTHVPDGGYVFDGSSSSGRNAVFTGQSNLPSQWVLFTGQDVIGGPPVDLETFQVHCVSFTEGHQQHWVNGDLIQEGFLGLDPMAGMVVGGRYTTSNRFNGDIAELLVYDTDLSDADRASVEGYLLAKHPVTEPPEQPELVTVFTSGQGGYPQYRIPAICTTRAGTVLAFAEGRTSMSDHAQNDMVMCRSTDGGHTFGPVVTIVDDGGNSLNNPCVVEVEAGAHEGRILLMYQRYPQGCHESCVGDGYTDWDVCRCYVVRSDDDGLSWSAPEEITTQVKRYEARSIAGGPGVGIQKRRSPNPGRIIIPFNQGISGAWDVYAAYSDDGGDTWNYGSVASPAQSPGRGNEVQMVELSDGRLMLNARSMGGTHHRKVAHSDDGGLTWSPLQDELQLIEPQCMASVFRLTSPLDGYAESRVLYAGPNSQSSRSQGTIHLSYDEGQTWSESRLIYAGGYAYSCLTILPGEEIGCFFERDNYQTIALAHTSIEWITEGADCAGEIAMGCEATANTAGGGVQLSLSGGTSLSSTSARLLGWGGIPGQPGVIFYGPDAISLPLGDGVRCVGGAPVRRLRPPITFDLFGTTEYILDYQAEPLGAGPATVIPGSTWHFQLWYRDPNSGGAGHNLSSSLRLTFCP